MRRLSVGQAAGSASLSQPSVHWLGLRVRIFMGAARLGCRFLAVFGPIRLMGSSLRSKSISPMTPYKLMVTLSVFQRSLFFMPLVLVLLETVKLLFLMRA